MSVIEASRIRDQVSHVDLRVGCGVAGVLKKDNGVSKSTMGVSMSKTALTAAEIDGLSAVELPDRNLFAVAVGAGGLVGVGVAIDRTLNDVLDIEDNNICVNVAAVGAAAACDQDQ